jgi:cytochrome c-type biogenesis protein
MAAQLSLSFLAGLLTTLSPCVLPILPMLMGGAVRKNKKAPLFMVIGLAVSFVAVGFTISRFGTILGLDNDQIRNGSATVLILLSVVFFSKKIQDFISTKMVSVASIGASAGGQLKEESAFDSLAIGALLGVVWSPCVGPTLGVAVSIAGQEGQALQALTIMSVYAFGAALPMLAISYGLKSLFLKYKKQILKLSENSKKIFGVVLLISGLLILSGVDKKIETYLLNHLPAGWVNLITEY